MLSAIPMFGVCGWSNSGKTTLIEAALPVLAEKGLRVLVLKHDVHGVCADLPAKDSGRLFQAGADVLLEGPGEQFIHCRNGEHNSSPPRAHTGALRALMPQYDLALVEGHKDSPLAKVWLQKDDADDPPASVSNVLAVLRRDALIGHARRDSFLAILDTWLAAQWLAVPVFGCILIGGRSSRMGSPKHLLWHEGKTWLERTAGVLRQVADDVVVVGAGEVPQSMADHVRLPDAPDAEGPMAGLLAAMRWNPRASWLAVSCDLPFLSADALRWLLSTRSPGVWGTLPRLHGNETVEPLLAHYDFRARGLLEDLAASRDFHINHVAADAKVSTPLPDPHIVAAWTNINTPADFDRCVGQMMG